MPQQSIDDRILSGAHDWNLEPEADPSFHVLVDDNASPRTDMRRYMSIRATEPQHARNCFSKLGQSGTLFRVPSTIVCNRTFARDEEEAYYLDVMDQYLAAAPEDLDIKDIPLLKRPLNNRVFNSFSRRPGYYTELYNGRCLGIWHPFDAFKNDHFSSASLSDWYPMVDVWLRVFERPPALPVPAPLVLYYYHTELRKAQVDRGNRIEISERAKRLLFCLEYEHYVLTLSTWWLETFQGGRQFVLSLRTIEFLEDKFNSVTEIVGKPARGIAEHMRIARLQPTNSHNWMTFEDHSMEDSTFVWAVVGVAVFDPQESPGVHLFCSREHLKTTTKRFSSAVFKRSCVLNKRITTPDLNRVPGLRTIADDQGWSNRGEMKMDDVLNNLVHLYYNTRGIMNTMLRDVTEPLRAANNGRYITDRPVEYRRHCDRPAIAQLEYDRPYDYERDRDRDAYMQNSARHHDDYGKYDRHFDDYRRDERQMFRSGDEFRGNSRNDYDDRGDGYDGYRDLDAPVLDDGNDGVVVAEEGQSINSVQVDVLTDGARAPAMSKETSTEPTGSAVRTPATTVRPGTATIAWEIEKPDLRETLLEKMMKTAREHPDPLPGDVRTFTPARPFLLEWSSNSTAAKPAHVSSAVDGTTTQNGEQVVIAADYTKQGSGNLPWGVVTGSASKRTNEHMVEEPSVEQQPSKRANVADEHHQSTRAKDTLCSSAEDTEQETGGSSAPVISTQQETGSSSAPVIGTQQDSGSSSAPVITIYDLLRRDPAFCSLNARHDFWTTRTLYYKLQEKQA